MTNPTDIPLLDLNKHTGARQWKMKKYPNIVKSEEVEGLGVYNLHEDGIIRTKVISGAKITMEHCIKITKVQTILNAGTPRPLLVDGRGYVEMPEECRNYLLSDGQAKLSRACAFVVSENSSGLGLALINWYNVFKEQYRMITPHRNV